MSAPVDVERVARTISEGVPFAVSMEELQALAHVVLAAVAIRKDSISLVPAWAQVDEECQREDEGRICGCQACERARAFDAALRGSEGK